MRVHILGVCGTFMAGLAALARELGDAVSGCDAGIYPPMSDQLDELGIELYEGYDAAHLTSARPDLVVVGNAMTRGIPIVEALLESDLPYVSGPQWLAERALLGRPVLALAGTHGKTTTTSMLAYVLERSGKAPGFLIGGVCPEFDSSARLGAAGAPFVVEADEYDSAFFDKRSKFVHYRPRVLSISSIEFDHADIFDDIAAIRRQFHHVVRTVPGSGRVLAALPDAEIDKTLAMGCWSELQRFGCPAPPGAGAIGATYKQEPTWRLAPLAADWHRFELWQRDTLAGVVNWGLIGEHNAMNAASAIACADYVGVVPAQACEVLSDFKGVRRRMELRGEAGGVRVYDDFAHHPTAIATTLQGFTAAGSSGRVLAVVDLASNTMKMGVHEATLGAALTGADSAWLHVPAGATWDVQRVVRDAPLPVRVLDTPDAIVAEVAAQARSTDRVLVMSNGGFGGLHAKLLAALG